MEDLLISFLRVLISFLARCSHNLILLFPFHAPGAIYCRIGKNPASPDLLLAWLLLTSQYSESPATTV